MKSPMVCLALVASLGLAAARADEVTKDDVPRLRKMLKGGAAKDRVAAADDLGKLGAVYAPDARPAAPDLIAVLKKDSDAKVREAVARALGRIDPDPKDAVPVLKEALKDKSAPVRRAAAGAL